MNRRKLKNFIFDPVNQLKVSYYSLSVVLVVLAGVLYVVFSNLSLILNALTAQPERLDDLVAQIDAFLMIAMWISMGTLLGLAIYNLFLAVIMTHRFLGPMIPFRRQLRALIEGQYSARVTLRKTDQFQDVAQDLNELAAQLEAQQGST